MTIKRAGAEDIRKTVMTKRADAKYIMKMIICTFAADSTTRSGGDVVGNAIERVSESN